MDGETAMAFAGQRFEQLHPRETWPEWLLRCSMASYHKDKTGSFVVSLSVTPVESNNSVKYFEAVVDPSSGDTTVTIDMDVFRFVGSELQGF
jgi:hypothetical protein